jgi:hypothetical protein
VGDARVTERDRARDAVGWRVVEATARVAREVLANRLASVYAIGSLAHGGFSPAISDIDVAVLTADEQPTDVAAEQIARRVRAQDVALADRLSIFHAPWAWLSQPQEGSRFPAIDRLDLLRHGVLVTGADERERYGRLPSPEEIREEAIEFFVAGLSPASLVAFDPAAGVRATTKAVLKPVRLWHAARAGLVTSNDGAVDHYLTTAGVRNARLVDAAADWRKRGEIPDLADAAALIDSHLLDLHAEVLELVAQTPNAAAGSSRDAIADALRDLRLARRAGETPSR